MLNLRVISSLSLIRSLSRENKTVDGAEEVFQRRIPTLRIRRYRRVGFMESIDGTA